jgi:integrase
MATIRQDPDITNRKSYMFSVMVDGKRAKRRGFKSKKEAEAAMAGIVSQMSKGDYHAPSKETLKVYYERWLKDRTNISESTRDLYRSYLKTHIDPALGHYQLSKLTPQLIQTFVKELKDKGLADETVKRIYSAVHTSLNAAVKMEIINKNVADKIEKPRVIRVERKIWSEHSMRNFIEQTRGKTRYWIAIFLAVMTGMRQGEILGLKWSDIDFDKKVLYVRRGLKKDKTGFTDLKTDKSRRTISLSPTTIRILDQQKSKVLIEKEHLGSEYQDDDLVVCSSKGTPARATKILHAWNRLCEKFKPTEEPHMTFHDLRHQSASLLLNDGISIRIVSERLGHSNVSTTMNIYSHLLPDAQQEAALSLDHSIGIDFDLVD